MHSNIENDKENRETDPVLTEVNRKYTEIMNKINESEKKTLAYRAVWNVVFWGKKRSFEGILGQKTWF